METEEVETPKPKPRKKAVKKEEQKEDLEVAVAVSGGIQLMPEISEEEKKELEAVIPEPPFVEVKPEPIVEQKKVTVEYGTENPKPIMSEPPSPPKPKYGRRLKLIITLCVIILIAAGLSYWAVITLW